MFVYVKHSAHHGLLSIWLTIASIFCVPAILAQEGDQRSQADQYEFMDRDESDDEIASELARLKACFSLSYPNQILFSQESGFYYEDFFLDIGFSGETEDPIFYTLDGSLPTPSSIKYLGAIDIQIPEDAGSLYKAYVVRARSFSDTVATSQIASKTYLTFSDPDDRFSYPVISLLSDPGNFFDYDTGIYVKGANYDTGNSRWTGNYFMTGIEWERDVRIHYLTTSGELVLDQDAGVRIHGGLQRTAPQKSLRFYAREEYGQNKFNYQLLPQKKKNEYKRFLLRTSFGCWNSTIIKDHLAASLVKGLGFEIMDYRPVIVFLNGEYWGIQTIRDYFGVHYISEQYDVDKDSVNIGLDTWTYEGSPEKAIELDQILDSTGFSDSELLQEIGSRLDISSTINYYNAEIYLNNYDWPNGNRRWWYVPEYDKGRMDWLFYDVDASFNGRGGVGHNMLYQATVPSDGWPNPPQSTKLLNGLLEIPYIRNEFITRAAYLMNYKLHADTIIPVINRIKAEYALEMPGHFARWNSLSDSIWESRIESALIAFARDRRDYVNQHYISKFGLSGTSKLTIDVIPRRMGQVYIADMPVPYLNNTGVYFNDVPIRLIAIPEPGYQFSHWELPYESDSDTISITLSADTSIVAVFEPGNLDERLIKINEVMSKNRTSIRDNKNELEDWIEIYNGGENAFDLSGLFLSDKHEDLFKWRIPDLYSDSVRISPQGFILFYADKETSQGVLHCNFKLNSSGESIFLTKKISGFPVILDSMTYQALTEDVSWGRVPDGSDTLLMMDIPSPLGTNQLPSSILKQEFEGSLIIYPNPAGDFVHIHLDSEQNQSNRFVIYNMSGIIIKTLEYFGSEQSIDISDLQPGVYIVGLEGDPIHWAKLLIQ